jgi:exodeoxyribonuclease V beta subunit
MSDSIKYNPFNAATVSLEGSNLIEASAGTGKTYSIAILVLRLLLEKKIAIKEILMVTFTKAAVAELQERVRYFVRSAYKVSQGKIISDDNIKKLVQHAIENSGAAIVKQQLNDAVLFLDETSVLTIHSFCQQTLNEFAFETNQLFGTEMIPEIKSIIEEELNKSWRKNITTMPVALLGTVWNDNMKEGMKKAIEEHLSGKKYFGYDEAADYALSESHHDDWVKSIQALAKKKSEMREALHQYLNDNKQRIINTTTNSYAKRNVLPLIESPQEFLDYIWNKRSSGYIPTTFPELLVQLEAYENCLQEYNQTIQNIISHLNHLIIQEVSEGVELFKLRNNLLSYDDMILNLHKALIDRDNPALVKALQEKYKVVFVDEFQDTDRQQFEIFDKAFAENTILFYIGDPKQSIYAWRKADIFTYFKARNAVRHVYGMNHNYRSSASLIAAMNRFFVPSPGFDTFFFNDDKEAIQYHPVESPEPNSKGILLKKGNADIPVSIFKAANKEALNEALAAQVAELLRDGIYSINIKDRKINPSDIGILVRTGEQGRSVKAALARSGIPAVTIDDSKVLQSNEAVYLLYLMEAMASPGRSTINRALLSPFTGLDSEEVILLDDEITLMLFNRYKVKWQQDGIYTALMDFVADFGVRNVLLHEPNESGERMLTNMFQIMELLHQMQSRKNLSMSELISWLKRGIDGMVTEGDEYSQRVESDEEAVKIVTIHKSKGLEYNIVLAPFLDFTPNSKNIFFSFRSPDSGDYMGVEKSRLSSEQQVWYNQQSEQENRRLLYVAITRAVYKCFIFKNEHFKNSTLTTFLNALENVDPDLIKFEERAPVKQEHLNRKSQIMEPGIIEQPVNFSLLEQNWRKMSYTMLAAKGDIGLRARSQKTDDPYETFILHTLRRGAKTGNLLHYIFENINFSDETHWDRLLKEAIRRFVPGQQEQYMLMLRYMLHQVFSTEITLDGIKFHLADVDYHKRIPEFEFDFPVPEFFPDALNDLSDELSSVNVKGFQELNSKQLEGIMNGKMDLFFENLGRYYILDWKSNYLGPVAEDYSAKMLAVAMNESNYHLQYLIYTLAAKKYLESRLPSFDYETQFGGVIYLFVRGIRYGTDSGIYTCKPSWAKIVKLEDTLTYKVFKTL